MAPTRRRKPDNPKVRPRQVVENVGAAVRAALGNPPPTDFAEGVQAGTDYVRRMCPDSEAGCDLGPYIPLSEWSGRDGRDREEGVELDNEPTMTIRFPGWFRRWFASQTRHTLSLLTVLVGWLSPHQPSEVEERLSALDDIIDRHLARKALLKTWKKVFISGIALVPSAWLGVLYFGDKVSKVVEQWPIIRGLWKAIMGGAV